MAKLLPLIFMVISGLFLLTAFERNEYTLQNLTLAIVGYSFFIAGFAKFFEKDINKHLSNFLPDKLPKKLVNSTSFLIAWGVFGILLAFYFNSTSIPIKLSLWAFLLFFPLVLTEVSINEIISASPVLFITIVFTAILAFFSSKKYFESRGTFRFNR